MVFKGWQKTSLNEWPGKVCSVVWTSGCNFCCPFCYNYDLVLNPEKLPLIKEKQILDYCKKNKDLLDGIMITGGEPLINKKEDLIRFIKKAKKLGLKIGIETNGTNPKMIQFLIVNDLVDYLAMDIKAPLIQERYDQITGGKVDLKNIKKSVKIIIDSEIDSEFRTTVVPGLLNQDDILKITQDIKGAKKYYLQQFQPGNTLGKVPKLRPYSQEWFKKTARKIKDLTNIELRI
ncbi:anaerobic ribonucleoside-triphosphate reductase activating protein [Patescibacteria group bacterium]|nr:anaerobic ribonucleoside-triphosphate reductase activating protein [Patescibacteria group bacterium]